MHGLMEVVMIVVTRSSMCPFESKDRGSKVGLRNLVHKVRTVSWREMPYKVNLVSYMSLHEVSDIQCIRLRPINIDPPRLIHFINA